MNTEDESAAAGPAHGGDGSAPPPKSERSLREERLQAQLRANLKRRKEQARARAVRGEG